MIEGVGLWFLETHREYAIPSWNYVLSLILKYFCFFANFAFGRFKISLSPRRRPCGRHWNNLRGDTIEKGKQYE